jgi:hypothetical protein
MRYLLVLLLVGACAPDPVGRRCDLGRDPASTETVISTGSLDCISRTCLHVAGGQHDLCTAPCESDDDCVGDPSTPCSAGFACATVTAVGPFADEPMCVCRDDLATR